MDKKSYSERDVLHKADYPCDWKSRLEYPKNKFERKSHFTDGT